MTTNVRRSLVWVLCLSACMPMVALPDGGIDELDAGGGSSVRDAGSADAGRAGAGLLDAGSTDAGRADAGLPDAGSTDAGRADAGLLDAGSSDAGRADAGLLDAGSTDAGRADAGLLDAGSTDAGRADAGLLDAGSTDAGRADAGLPDAGSTDAGRADAGLLDAGAVACTPFDAGPTPPRRARACGDGGWAVCFEGVDLPGADGPAHLFWDNAIDDDWFRPGFADNEVLINQIEAGRTFMRVQRPRPNDPAWFHRRDTQVTSATGYVVEFGVRVWPDSEDAGLIFSAIEAESDAGLLEGYALLINPTGLVFSSQAGTNPNFSRPVSTGGAVRYTWPTNTAGTFIDLRVERAAGTNEVVISRLLPAGPQLLFSGAGPLTVLNRPQAVTTQLAMTFGDTNSNATGHFDWDYLRLKPLNAPQPLEPLPARRAITPIRGASAAPVDGGLSFAEATCVSGAVACPTSCYTRRPTATLGQIDLLSRHNTPTAPFSAGILCGYEQTSFNEREPFTVEVAFRWRAAGCGSTGARLGFVGPGHQFGVVLEPDRITPVLATRPVSGPSVGVSYLPINRLRIVRPANAVHAQVYLNDRLVLQDVKSSSAPDFGKPDAGPDVVSVTLGRDVIPPTPVVSWALSRLDAAVPATATLDSPIELLDVWWAFDAAAP